ncbi:MAG: cystathionine beta-synthase [Candidatus Cyclobacteriaceae bacterium M2_1C_046]
MPKNTKMRNYIKDVIKNMPEDWLRLTTHRLDIYNEELAKVEFTEQFEALYQAGNAGTSALAGLPTAYDYVRLGHPLSSVLEWAIAKENDLQPENIISFSSQTVPILAVLRKNLFKNSKTQIVYKDNLPASFDAEVIQRVYGYNFELKQVDRVEEIADFKGSTVYVSNQNEIDKVELNSNVDFFITNYPGLGSILVVNGDHNKGYISEIQHVRRRETIAMTPANCFSALKSLTGESVPDQKSDFDRNKAIVVDTVKEVTATKTPAVIGSSGLSIQYAIMMGLLEDAQINHPGKAVKFIIPPNCYGGTNDQARRVAACHDHVEILDLPVDRNHNMVQSTKKVLDEVAQQDAVSYIIVEIPTNPRVEVPNLNDLRDVLSAERRTPAGELAIDPVFIIDQTFCPNIQFLKEGGIFSSVRTLSYVSGSKFPSGGKCTAGYCVANDKASALMTPIEKHLKICDNEATDLQVEFLAQQMPSMNQRISDAYKNTREFVNYIKEILPAAKINFVSEELANEGFTPSVFSLDLPTKGNSDAEKEAYKRALNLRLINMMITKIPDDSKYCVSYGQLKGCYWTIPATSTQGTTKEADKDYIARVSVSPKLDLERHKEVFREFVDEI